MAVRIGILGEASSVSIGATTVYTVGADLAARVRVSFQMEGPAAVVNWSVKIGTPTNQDTVHKSTTSNLDVLSGSWMPLVGVTTTPNPPLSILAAHLGIQEYAGLLDLSDVANGGFEQWTAALPVDYFLSTGDTVRYQINGADATAVLVQVEGVEDDA